MSPSCLLRFASLMYSSHDAEVARALIAGAYRVVGVGCDVDDAARAVAHVVEPDLAVGDDEHLAGVVAVHRVGATRRVLDVGHRRHLAVAVRQRLEPDGGHAGVGRVGAFVGRPLEVVLVHGEDAVGLAHGSGSIPNIARKSSVVLTWGKGSLGTGIPSFSQ